MADPVVTAAPTPVAATPASSPAPMPNPAPSATPAPAPAPVAAAAPVAAPKASPEPTAAPVSATPAAAASATPAPAVAPAAEAPKPVEGTPAAPKTSLLAEAKETPESPAPASSDAAPATTEAPAAQAPLPSYDALTLPEGITLDNARVGEFDGLLGRYEQSSQGDHAQFTALRQDLVNMYLAEKQRDMQLQHENWNRTRDGWKQQIKDNPEYGKSRFEQTMKDAAVVRDRFATPQFLQMIEFTGAGDHPGMIEFVNNIAKELDKHGLLREGRPLATTIKPVQAPQRKSQRRYGNGPNMNGA